MPFRSIQFIGTQRSGSNLLRLILNQHDLISAPHPPHLLRTFIPLLQHYRLAYGNTLERLVEDVCRWVELNPVPWTKIVLDREKILARSASVCDIYEQIYLHKAEADKAEIWCCKSTFNINYVDLLEENIKPFYIHLYRDGRDVAASFKKVIVGHKHVYHLAHQWRKEQLMSLGFLKGIEEERKIHVSYESLLERPDEIVGAICSKLGVEYSSSMLRYYNSEESHHTAESGKMWEDVAKPIIKNNRGKYHNELSEEELGIFEKVAGDVLEKFGYTPGYHKENNIILDVEQFNLLNAKWINERRKMANSQELEKRMKQEFLLKEIKNRLGIE